MHDAKHIAGRVALVRARNAARDVNYMKLIAIRDGDYDRVAPGMFNTAEFDKPLVANLIDTTARDIAEVMAPLPAVNCHVTTPASEADTKRQDLRGAIANGYVQNSRLQDQMFGGADRFGSFGFMAYVVEPDFKDQMPVIRVDDAPYAYYTQDYRGRVKEYFTVHKITCDTLAARFPEHELRERFKARWGDEYTEVKVEIARWIDDSGEMLVLLDQPNLVLARAKNPIGRCPVRIVERPKLEGDAGPKGQFDDVIWVQIARALVQMYTMNALEQSVNAPISMPKDVDQLEIGPFTAIQTDGRVERVNLNLSPGLFPQSQLLAGEQRTGSRYPEGRSGNIDASIITGQGVQALMGTFDTQVQTFQRLNMSALEDVIGMCFEMDEALWGSVKKTRRIKENGAPRKYTYTPSKDIDGDYTVDVSYGAIAGLDPNRGLVFVLQALAGGLIAKSTARKTLPVDLNIQAEERQIQLEQIDDAVAATLASLPQAIPMMATSGMDPREVVMQTVQVRKLVQKGKSITQAMEEVFAPKETEEPQVDPMQAAMEAAMGGDPAAAQMMPGAGGGGASDMLMQLAGMTPGGNPNLQANVSRMQPI